MRVVAAFIYDLNSDDILLLDRFHQAVSFPDIVIGVQTKAPAAIIDFRSSAFILRCIIDCLISCNGKSMQFDPRDSTRAVLGSLLQTTWGVAPT